MTRKAIPKGKVAICVYIPRELYEAVKDVAPRFYGGLRGALSHAVTEALWEWLALRQHTQIHTNPSDKIRKKFMVVVRMLRSVTGLPYVPDEVPSRYLELAIAQSLGSDQRTVRKYLSLFEKAGLIKFLGGGLVEIVAKNV